MPLVQLTDGPADGVRVLTLDDPDHRNALSPELQQQLRDQVETVARDADARVLVVSGNGPAFCSGADLQAVFAGAAEGDTAAMRARLRVIYDSFLRIRHLEIPTIAAVHGAAVGAGVNLAMACDIRIAGPRARFGITFTKLGLHPGGGCTWFLMQALGRQRTMQLIMDGEVLEAREALSLGLVLDVVDEPLASALETAASWARVDPALARDIKRALSMAEHDGFEETLEFEAWAQAASTRNPLLAAAIARYGSPGPR
jgi:enoyl-CoA hydratase